MSSQLLRVELERDELQAQLTQLQLQLMEKKSTARVDQSQQTVGDDRIKQLQREHESSIEQLKNHHATAVAELRKDAEAKEQKLREEHLREVERHVNRVESKLVADHEKRMQTFAANQTADKKKHMSALERQNQDLQAEMKKTENENRELRERSRNLEKEMGSLSKENVALTSRTQELQGGNMATESQVRYLREKLDFSNREMTRLKEEDRDLRKEMADAAEQNLSLAEQLEGKEKKFSLVHDAWKMDKEHLAQKERGEVEKKLCTRQTLKSMSSMRIMLVLQVDIYTMCMSNIKMVIFCIAHGKTCNIEKC